MNNYRPIIGLEVHIELSTKSKMFCSCSCDHFNKPPNSLVCPICLGLPGALPFPNRKAIESVIKIGLALNLPINNTSKFDRKHYFYPDLPKSYQISQYDLPLCGSGPFKLSVDKTIGIRRVHLEEDTAKLIHKNIGNDQITLVNFNRSGIPLMELVTEPDFNDSDQAITFLKEIQLITRYLEISDCDMEKGSMRLEANISVAKVERVVKLPDYKVEIKNINSFKFIDKAINYEIKRQTNLLKDGRIIRQETRGYNEQSGITYTQRFKEEAHDYRYFPEPDISPISIDKELLEKLKGELPDLPGKLRAEYSKNYKLPNNYIEILVSDIKKNKIFQSCVKLLPKANIKAVDLASFIINSSFKLEDITQQEIFDLIANKKKSYEISKEDYVTCINDIITKNKKAVDDFKKGKLEVIGFLVGQVNRNFEGKADPKKIAVLIKTILK